MIRLESLTAHYILRSRTRGGAWQDGRVDAEQVEFRSERDVLRLLHGLLGPEPTPRLRVVLHELAGAVRLGMATPELLAQIARRIIRGELIVETEPLAEWALDPPREPNFPLEPYVMAPQEIDEGLGVHSYPRIEPPMRVDVRVRITPPPSAHVQSKTTPPL
jgi:hypothetical protein